MRLLYIIVCCMFFGNCSGQSSKKMTLPKEERKEAVEAVEVFVPQAGVKYNEIRSVDPNDPPINIPMDKEFTKVKSLNLEAKQIRLKHPEGKSFFEAISSYRLMNATVPISLMVNVIVSNNYIVVGDPFTGIHCYSLDGKFLHTIYSGSNERPEKGGEISVDMKTVKNILASFSVLNDVCLYTTVTEGVQTHCIYNIKDKKEVKKSYQHIFYPLLVSSNSNSILDNVYKGNQGEGAPIMVVSQLAGDTICVFNNYNMIPKILGSTYHSFRTSFIYYFNNKFNIRHAGNDTIFCLEAENRLKPKYILNFGEKKATVQDYVSGTLEKKIVINDIKETKELLIVQATSFGESKSESEKKTICYNKQTKALFELEDFTVKNSPVNLTQFASNNGKLIATLSYSILERSKIRDEAFVAKYPNLKETGDIVVLIIE